MEVTPSTGISIQNEANRSRFPRVVTRNPSLEDRKRLNELSEIALRELRQELQDLEEIYPPADEETLAKTANI